MTNRWWRVSSHFGLSKTGWLEAASLEGAGASLAFRVGVCKLHAQSVRAQTLSTPSLLLGDDRIQHTVNNITPMQS